jgi:hypothetical protein
MAIRRTAAKGGAAALSTLVAIAISWGPGVQTASACDCSSPRDDAVALDGADAAFTGTLVERIDPDPVISSADPVRYVFDVAVVHKGTVGPRVEVESAWDGASCGAAISADSPMFVVARDDGERLTTAQCSGTRPLTDPAGPPQLHGEPPATSVTESAQPPDREVSAAPSTRTSCEEGAGDCDDQGGGASSTPVVLLAVVAAVAAIAAAGLVAVARRARRGAA